MARPGAARDLNILRGKSRAHRRPHDDGRAAEGSPRLDLSRDRLRARTASASPRPRSDPARFMTAVAVDSRVRHAGRETPLIFGGWEVGLLAIMAILDSAGLYLILASFGSSTYALFSVLRDASRYGVLAIGMTFVIVNKELDLSVGSTFGLTAAIFAAVFSTYFDMAIWTAVIWCLVHGARGRTDQRLAGHRSRSAGVHRHADDAVHRREAYSRRSPEARTSRSRSRRGEFPAFFHLGEINAFGFNNQIILFIDRRRRRRRRPCVYDDRLDDLSVGGNEQAARYAGINTRFVRMRSYVLSSLCAVTAGLMSVAQNKDADPLAGFGLELIAIPSVIVGGAAIFGGRGRILGSCLGAIPIGSSTRCSAKACPPPARSISATATPPWCRR